MMESGFNAMGKPVPANRLQKGYMLVKQLLNCDSELAWTITNRCKDFIQRDQCAYIIGCVENRTALLKNLFPQFSSDEWVDEQIGNIDLTGRYRLLAEMLTD